MNNRKKTKLIFVILISCAKNKTTSNYNINNGKPLPLVYLQNKILAKDKKSEANRKIITSFKTNKIYLYFD